MPELLCYCHDKEILREIEEVCITTDTRIKSTLECRVAIEWVKIKPFDVVLFDENINEADRHKVAEKVWLSNPTSSVYIYNPQSSNPERSSELLMEGVSLIWGEKAGNID